MRRALLAAAAAIALQACAEDPRAPVAGDVAMPAPAPIPCPGLAAYDARFLAIAEAEADLLPAPSAIATMLAHYRALRVMVFACHLARAEQRQR